MPRFRLAGVPAIGGSFPFPLAWLCRVGPGESLPAPRPCPLSLCDGSPGSLPVCFSPRVLLCVHSLSGASCPASLPAPGCSPAPGPLPQAAGQGPSRRCPCSCMDIAGGAAEGAAGRCAPSPWRPVQDLSSAGQQQQTTLQVTERHQGRRGPDPAAEVGGPRPCWPSVPTPPLPAPISAPAPAPHPTPLSYPIQPLCPPALSQAPIPVPLAAPVPSPSVLHCPSPVPAPIPAPAGPLSDTPVPGPILPLCFPITHLKTVPAPPVL